MKFYPILYSSEMVIAILENRKKQTRRTKGLEKLNKNPNDYKFYGIDTSSGDFVFENISPDRELKGDFPMVEVKCPFGQIGDVLWVRETFQKIEFVKSGNSEYLYKANVEYFNPDIVLWTPSIHMPKEACRLFLKITNIKVERLNDISEQDAIAEGCSLYGPFDEYRGALRNNESAMKYNAFSKASRAFRNIWESINSEESWKSNPWVWAIEFEKVDEPENFV